MIDYYLQRKSDGGFDVVDKYVWENYGKAVTTDGQPVYNGNCFAVAEGGQVTISGRFTADQLSKIMRVAAIQPYDPNAKMPGFIQVVEFVRMIVRGKKALHEINGATYKSAA